MTLEEKVEEFKSYLGFYIGDEWLITFFADMLSQAVQTERERILSELPPRRPIPDVFETPFNSCLEQVKDIINKK